MPCGRKLADGQYWHFCGETDMGQGSPALCVRCGGSLQLDAKRVPPCDFKVTVSSKLQGMTAHFEVAKMGDRETKQQAGNAVLAMFAVQNQWKIDSVKAVDE